MLTQSNRFAILGITASLLAAGNVAKAQTTGYAVPTLGGGNPASFSFNYNLFNSSTGTLGGVTVEFVADTIASVNIANASGTSQTFSNASASFPLSVSGPAAMNLSGTVQTSGVSGTALPGSGSFNDFPTSGITTLGPNSILPSTLWPGTWEAAGGGTSPGQVTVTLGSGSFGGTETSGTGDLFFGGSGTVTGTFYVTYSSVSNGTPEPGTWALLFASGAVSLAGIRRRRAVK